MLERKKQKYIRKCGMCGVTASQENMVRTDASTNGWFCKLCAEDIQLRTSSYYTDGKI